ncbi:MAG: hypothetical protein WCL14_01535 [Bacteroidota bacterium]
MRFLVSIKLFLALLVLSTPSISQSLSISKGMILKYDCYDNGNKYRMQVMVTETMPDVALDIILFDRFSSKYHVVIKKDALKSSSKVIDSFTQNSNLTKGQTCFWLSESSYNSFRNMNETTLKMDSLIVKYYVNDLVNHYLDINGNSQNIKSLFVAPSAEPNNYLLIADMPNFPLMVKKEGAVKWNLMELDTVIKTTENSSTAGVDLTNLPGKTIYDSSIFFLINNQLSPMEILPSITEYVFKTPDGETKEIHYELNCINEKKGCSMQFINDTLNRIILYNKSANEGYKKYSQYKDKLPFGLNFAMNRKEVEKIIGKPDVQDNKARRISYKKKNIYMNYSNEDESKATIDAIEIHWRTQ